MEDLVLAQDVLSTAAKDFLPLALLLAERVGELVDALAETAKAAQVLPPLGALFLLGSLWAAADIVRTSATAPLLKNLSLRASVLAQAFVDVPEAARQKM